MALSILTFVLSSQAAEGPADINLAACKPFTLSVDHRHTLTGDRLTQTFDVAEGETFRVVATVNGIRWTTKGAIGKIKDGTITVELTDEWFKDDQSNLKSKTRFDLKLSGEESGIGSANGVLTTLSIRRNEARQ